MSHDELLTVGREECFATLTLFLIRVVPHNIAGRKIEDYDTTIRVLDCELLYCQAKNQNGKHVEMDEQTEFLTVLDIEPVDLLSNMMNIAARQCRPSHSSLANEIASMSINPAIANSSPN